MDEESSPRTSLSKIPNIDIESPISSIASDLSKSSLDSGSAKKHHFPRSRGVFGTSHRGNDQRSERSYNTQEKHYFKKEFHPRELQEVDTTLGKYDCNKENSGATSTSYYHTPQRVRSKKILQSSENFEENSQDSGHPSSPISEKEKKLRKYYAEDTRTRSCGPVDFRSFSSYPTALPPAQRTRAASSTTFLRSLSSGYESMDDGLVSELNDIATMDEEVMQLPSGISKLLSGDIVAPEASTDYDVSTTPDFSRNKSSKVRKWLSVQNNKLSIKAISPSLARSPLLARSPSLERTPSLARSPLEKMPPTSKIRTCLFRSPTATCSSRMMRTYSYDEASAPYYRLQMETSPSIRSYKRPSENLDDDEASILKRSRKSNSCCLDATPSSASRCSSTLTHSQVTLQRSLSEMRRSQTETHTNIKWAIHRSITDNDLIGDFSKPCILPLTNGIHADLKTVTSDTLAALLRGEFEDRVNSYTIIDCRYPYEYKAGHIEGAVNIYNMDLIQQIMFDHLGKTVPLIGHDTEKRNILVFHCEFSWERGPNLSRVLRRLDRDCNKEHYPALHYPEIYLLLGGYEKFYSKQKEFCTPQDYKPMKHPNHEEECRFFRSKCKSWQAEKTKEISQTVRTNLERFAF